jgi:hypothetical protein
VIDINENGHGKTLKNAHSARLIPIHETLKRLGFMEFVETRRKRGADTRLFGELSRAKAPGDAFGKWFCVLSLKSIGVADRQFHCFRHLRAKLAEIGTAPDRVDQLGGWSGEERGMQSVYGQAISPRTFKMKLPK